MLKSLSILESTKNYIIVKIPRTMLVKSQNRGEKELTEKEALMICKEAEEAYHAGKTKILSSLKDLR